MVEIIEGISGVGIAAQGDVRPARADAVEYFDVPAGLDLDLDAAVAGGEFSGDFFQQLLDALLNADGDSAGDLAMGAPQQLPQREIFFAGGVTAGPILRLGR